MSARIPLLKPRSNTFVCPKCQLRSSTSTQSIRFLSATTPRQITTISDNKSPKYAHLTNRALLRLAGPDAANFLHNIIPAKILGAGTNPIFTAFLSAQGRILNDVFIYPPSWDGDAKHHEWIIETDEKGVTELLKHLKKHKLRAKFQMERVNGEKGGMKMIYAWPGLTREGEQQDIKRLRAGGQDPRPGMGMRMVVDGESESSLNQWLTDEGGKEGSLDDYTVHRILNGAAEGQQEIIPGSALPQESNLDFVGGIDFFKGCYLGQELTIRTHHTGVVRKRILPCQIYDDSNPISASQTGPEYQEDLQLSQPEPGSNLSKLTTRKGRSTGKWLDGIGNIGLALCRLEMMTDIQLTADTTGFNPDEEYRVQWDIGEDGKPAKEIRVKPFVPEWIRVGIGESLHRKEKKPKRRHEEEDEDEVD